MDFLYELNLENLTGIPSDIFILGLAALVIILIILMIVNGVRMAKLKKSYRAFMEGRMGIP